MVVCLVLISHVRVTCSRVVSFQRVVVIKFEFLLLFKVE